MVPPAQGGLDGNIIALVSSVAVSITTILGLLFTRMGNRKSEDAKRIDQVILGYQNQIDNLQDDLMRKTSENKELRDEVRELKADNRQLEQLRRDEFNGAVNRLFPEVRLPPELPPNTG